jgi:DNA-directed RNA polymerase specialized sigma24 family protein
MTTSAVTSLLLKSDEDLVVAAKEGNDTAAVVLVARYKDAVMNCTTRMTGNEKLGLEATLRVMEIVRRDPGRLGGAGKCSVHLFILALRISRAVLRDSTHLLPRATPAPAPLFDLDDGPPPEYVEGPQEKIQRCLSAIPVKYRGYLVLRDVMGMSYEDIAAVFDETLDRARTMSDRARDQLHAALGRD